MKPITEQEIEYIKRWIAGASPAPWRGPASLQPWPDAAANVNEMKCATGGTAIRGDWSKACQDIAVIMILRNYADQLIAEAEDNIRLREALKTIVQERDLAYLLRLSTDEKAELEKLRTEVASLRALNELVTKGSFDATISMANENLDLRNHLERAKQSIAEAYKRESRSV